MIYLLLEFKQPKPPPLEFQGIIMYMNRLQLWNSFSLHLVYILFWPQMRYYPRKLINNYCKQYQREQSDWSSECIPCLLYGTATASNPWLHWVGAQHCLYSSRCSAYSLFLLKIRGAAHFFLKKHQCNTNVSKLLSTNLYCWILFLSDVLYGFGFF